MRFRGIGTGPRPDLATNGVRYRWPAGCGRRLERTNRIML